VNIRHLKEGAMLHVLVILVFDGACNIERLHHKTGWSKKAIHDAVAILTDEDHHMVNLVPNGRWPVYEATANARQLLLPNLMVISARDGSAGSSSSLTNESDSLKQLLLPPVIGAAEGSASDLSTAFPQVKHYVAVAPLTALGCPQARAIEAVTQALGRGETLDALLEKIKAGKAHAGSPAGRSIHSPGHWLAAAIADGRAIPQPPAPVDLEDTSRYDDYLPFADNAPNQDPDETP